MTITEAVADVYLRATGKTTTLTTGTKFNKIIGLLNHYQKKWSRESGIDWNSLYNAGLSIGTVTATDTFGLDTNAIRKISDREGDCVRIVWSDGVGYTDYLVVPHDYLKDYYYGPNKENSTGFVCTQIGKDLVFNHTFTTLDPQYAGEIFVPSYTFADPIVSTAMDEDVQVDDPDWLVVACAAEYVRTDLTRQSQHPFLIQEANAIMERMKDDNGGQIDLVNRPWAPFSGVGNDSAWN